MLDDQSRRLLRNILADPEASVSEIAQQSGMTAATATRRVDKMTNLGIIRGQHAVINWQALGYYVEVSLRFSLDKTLPRAFDEFLAAARIVPEVIEIQTFLGRVDVRLSIVAHDIAHYQEIYRTRILNLPHIADIEALMHISTIKNDSMLPL